MENLSKKITSIAVIFIMLFAIIIPTLVKAESTKDVWIDNTVDNSTSKVTGILRIKNLETGEETEETIYGQTTAVTFSNPKSATVLAMIDEAKNALIEEAGKYVDTFDPETIVESESTGKVWDYRKYETIEDGDAVLIGDANYISDNTISNDMTRTHIASGDYGKETFYTLEAYVEYTPTTEPPVEEPQGQSGSTEYNFKEGANQKYTKNVDDTATFIVDADYSLFEEGGVVYVDDNEVGSKNYSSKSGSTVITFTKEYMNSLSDGEHSLKIAFNNGGTATTNFTVEEAPTTNNPKTGDDITLMVVLFAMLTLGIFVMSKKDK